MKKRFKNQNGILNFTSKPRCIRQFLIAFSIDRGNKTAIGPIPNILSDIKYQIA